MIARRWNLEMFEFAPVGQWVRLKLHIYAERQRDNRSLSLSWNGQRLNYGGETGRLADSFPAVAEELVEWLQWAQP